MSVWFRMMLLGMVFAVVVGCGRSKDARQMQAVSGMITLDGQPLEDGEIFFKTVSKGEIDVLPIEDGQFQGEVGVGQRRVEIYAYHETEVVPMPGEPPEKTRENYIPARYNVDSTLSADVGPDSAAPLQFEIESE